MSPKPTLIPEISSENTFTNFYQTFDGQGFSPYKTFGTNGDVRFDTWPGPDKPVNFAIESDLNLMILFNPYNSLLKISVGFI